MSAHRKPETIRIGIMAEEPLRLAGLSTVFDQPGYEGRAKLAPVPGTMLELLANPALKYLVVDMQSSSSGMKALETVRRARPDLRMIVIGPAGNEELVMKCIVAGARAYLASMAQLHQGLAVGLSHRLRRTERISNQACHCAAPSYSSWKLGQSSSLRMVSSERRSRKVLAAFSRGERAS